MNLKSPLASGSQPRFVVLRHLVPAEGLGDRGDHFDLMLECDCNLATWAVSNIPEVGETVPATRLPNHRKEYLEYEGPVSGGRGTVDRVRAGFFRVLQSTEDVQLVELVVDDGTVKRLKINSRSDEVTTISSIN